MINGAIKAILKGFLELVVSFQKNILNPGIHSVTLFINVVDSNDIIIHEEKIITFEVKESPTFRTEFFKKMARCY